jgi:hypothetical protein
MLFICFMERAQRRVLIQYPKRQTRAGMMQQDRSHLPLKLNTAGVIPPIFASSLLLMPLTIAQFAGSSMTPTAHWGEFVITLNQYAAARRSRSTWPLRAGIIFFCFFYTAVVFNPEETAENLKKNGGFIPGIRPGKRTEEYLDYVLTRITVIGALSDLVCLIPEYRDRQTGIQLLPRRHQPADRGQRHDGHDQPDPVAPAGAPVWRPDQEGEAEGPSPLAGQAAGEGQDDEHHPAGPAGRGQGHPGARLVEQHGMRPALDRRHAARRGQGRHAGRASRPRR